MVSIPAKTGNQINVAMPAPGILQLLQRFRMVGLARVETLSIIGFTRFQQQCVKKRVMLVTVHRDNEGRWAAGVRGVTPFILYRIHWIRAGGVPSVELALLQVYARHLATNIVMESLWIHLGRGTATAMVMERFTITREGSNLITA